MTMHYDRMLRAIGIPLEERRNYPVLRGIKDPNTQGDETSVAGAIRRADFNFMLGTVESLLRQKAGDAFDRVSASDELYVLTHVLLYEAWMQKKYIFSEGACWKLLNTSIKDVPFSILRSPFKEIALTFPVGIIKHPAGGWVETAYVHLDGPLFSVLLISESDGVNHEKNDLWKFLVIGQDGQTIDQAVQGTQDMAKAHRPDINTEDLFVKSWHGAEHQLMFIINCMLYITSAKADVRYITPTTTTSKKAKKIRRSLMAPYYEVGHTIVLDKETRAMYQGLSSGDGTKKTLDVSFLVCGHWRHQVFGAGRTERKLIWIEPFWKGDLRRVISSPHLVK